MSGLWHIDEDGGVHTFHAWDEDDDCAFPLPNVEIADYEIAHFVRVQQAYDLMQNRLAELRREQHERRKARDASRAAAKGD